MTEENKYLDTLFQSKFVGFEAEPPAHVWDNIHTRLHGGKGGSINPVNLATLAALVLISGLLGFSILKDSPEPNGEAAITDQAITVNKSSQTLAHYVPTSPSPPEVETGNPKSVSLPSPIAENSLYDANHIVKPSHKAQHIQTTNHGLSLAVSDELRLAKLKTRRSFSIHAGLQTDNSGNIAVRDSKDHPRYFSLGENERNYNRRANWQLGLFFTPAVAFYTDDSIPNQRSYTFDAAVKWIKNEFFLESGLGLSFSSDDGKYSIDYEKFLGNYDDVYNVTFDTLENGTVVPVYYTHVVNVYDTISRYKVENTRNHYTYLQIPVYAGFQKQVDRFGWFVKGGPVLSLLIHKNIAQPQSGNDRIVGLDQQMASRVNSYWQFALSAGISYQLSNKVSIAIEPTFRYYLNSQYDRQYISTPHPYSIGLRTGLLFNF